MKFSGVDSSRRYQFNAASYAAAYNFLKFKSNVSHSRASITLYSLQKKVTRTVDESHKIKGL